MKSLFISCLMLLCLSAAAQTGNIGIGTSNPQKKLHVFQGTSGGAFHTNATAVLESNTTNILQLSNSSNSIGGIYSGTNLTQQRSAIKFEADSSIMFTSGGTLNRMMLDNNGFLGINNFAPTSRLHVSNGISGNASYASSRIATFEDNASAYLQLLAPNANETGILAGNASTLIKSGIIFTADSSVFIRTGGNNTRLAVTDNGNTGIGTTLPGQRLEVNGKFKLGDDAATPAAGTIRWNSSLNDFEGFNGSSWLSFTNSAVGTIGTTEDLGQLTNYQATAAPTPGIDNRFADDIDIDGEWAVAGSRVEDVSGFNNAGVAHIYRLVNNAWQFFATIKAADPATGDFFGTSVAISGNYIVIGAPDKANGALTDQGAAYVFFYNGTTWAQQAKLINGVGNGDEYWGYDVDISGATLIIGAYQADDLGNVDEGKAFAFKRTGTTWNQNAVFTGSGNSASAYFGTSVSLDETGNYAVVGASIEEAVFVFFFNGTNWVQQVKILPPAGAPANRLFGITVSVSGNTLIAGAPGGSFDAGDAYIYLRTGTIWSLQSKITIAGTRNFATTVLIDGDYVLIGEPYAANVNACGTAIGNTGKVHIYKRFTNSWEKYLTLKIPGSEDGNQFGYAIALNAMNFAGSANGSNANGVSNAGKIIFGKLR